MTIYFVKGDGVDRIKIGHTNGYVENRVYSMQTGCPVTLRIIHEMEGDVQMERGIHHLLRDSRTIGEWFGTTKEVISFICDRINGLPWDAVELVKITGEREKEREYKICQERTRQHRKELEAKGFAEHIIVSIMEWKARSWARDREERKAFVPYRRSKPEY